MASAKDDINGRRSMAVQAQHDKKAVLELHAGAASSQQPWHREIDFAGKMQQQTELSPALAEPTNLLSLLVMRANDTACIWLHCSAQSSMLGQHCKVQCKNTTSACSTARPGQADERGPDAA